MIRAVQTIHYWKYLKDLHIDQFALFVNLLSHTTYKLYMYPVY